MMLNRRDIIRIISGTLATLSTAIAGRALAKSFQIAQASASPTPSIKGATSPNLPTVDDAQERLLGAEPLVDLAADGKATVRWKTTVPLTRGTIYLGVPTANQQLDYPIYSASAAIQSEQPTTEHQVTVDVAAYSKKFAPSYLEAGAGVIFYRLELFDPRHNAVRFIDRTFRFVKQGDRFRLGLNIVEGPFVAMTAKDRAVLWWKTDQAASGAVIVQGKQTPSPAVAELHVVALEGLQPGQSYNYTITSQVANDQVTSRRYTFRTEPSSEDFAFAFTCDGRTGALGGGETAVEGINFKSAASLAAGIHAKKAELVVFTGDLISGYTTSEDDFRAQLRSWKRAYAPLWHTIPIYTGMGNHESLFDSYSDRQANQQIQIDRTGQRSAEAVFASEFVNPDNGPEPEAAGLPPYKGAVYSFDYSNSHFCQLSSDYWYSSDPDQYGGNRSGRLLEGQLRWLEADLKAARQRGLKHLFVFVHQPAFPNGGHVQDSLWGGGNPTDTAIRDQFWQIVSEANVLAVFSGHEHNYSRTLITASTPVHKDGTTNPNFKNPVWQVLQGAAGAPFYMQDNTVPWHSQVKSFVSPTWAYSMISVRGERVMLETYSYTGEAIDSAELTAI